MSEEVGVMETSVGGDPHAQLHQDHILFMSDQAPARAASAPWRRISEMGEEVCVMETSIRGDPHAQLHQDHILFLSDQAPARAAPAPWRRIACICSGVIVLLAAFVFADIYSMISSASAHDLHVRLH